VVRSYLNGTEITDVVQGGQSDHWLNRKYQASVSILVEDYDPTFFENGGKLKITGITGDDADIDFHGFTKVESAEDGEDADGTVTLNAESPREMWEWRPARNGPASGDEGNYSKPTFLELGVDGAPVVMEDVLTQSLDDSDPNAGEGTLFTELGSFPGGGPDVSGAPADNPLTIEELAQLLHSTGQLDLVETFIDSGGNMAHLDAFHGNYGTDLSGTVEFQYATGSHNVKQIRRVRDATKLMNKLYVYLGPKIDDKHWKRLITALDPGVIALDPPYTDFLAARAASRTAWGVRMDVRIHDSFANESDAVPLYWNLWMDESVWRVSFRTLVNVTPVEGLEPTFDIGDIVGVEAGARFMGGLTGVQRVYGRKVTWDADGVVQIGEIVSSEDGG
jgi:hypothetical protein